MNWDPDKLEVLISQLPTATIAIYHGSEVDWEVTTGLGATLQAAAKQQQDAWTAWREYQNDQNDYDYDKERQLGRERQAAFESWKRVATAAGYQPVDSPWVAGIQRAGAAVNGTLCILGKQGRWGPLAHGLGGGNNVDVEALQWLAAQPGPRVWISDGRVTGGFYYGMLGSQGLEHLCEELCRRHRITRTPTVQAALKQLRVTIPSLAKLGI
jgi:hypothetical protein